MTGTPKKPRPMVGHARLAGATGGADADLVSANRCRRWGPDLGERAWGTISELNGGSEWLQRDSAWKGTVRFVEAGHGDNGAGPGATHRSGWTPLDVGLILDSPGQPGS